MVDKTAAILVADNLLTVNKVHKWVTERSKHAAIIVLESTPGEILTNFELDFTPAAILGNSKNLNDLVFKTAALCVVQDSSNLIPVVALESDPEIAQMYKEGGVLVVINGVD